MLSMSPVRPPARACIATVALLLSVGLTLAGCHRGETTSQSESAAMGESSAGSSGGSPCKEPWAKGFDANSCTMEDGSTPPIKPLYWPDVCNPQLAGWTSVQQSLDQLSWRSFLYTSWPAKEDGKPDASKSIGVEEGGKFAPVVWERYADAASLFGSSAATLTADDFGKAAPVPEGCSADGPRVLTMTSKIPHAALLAVRSALQSASSADAVAEGLQSIDQAFVGPLYPQGPEGPSGLWPVFYEIRINQVEYNAIVAAGAQNKTPNQLNCVNLLGCKPFTLPMESTEVKAAWKVLSQDEVASGRFFHQDLQVVDPVSGKCSVQPMGLVGLHIARKVKSTVIGSDPRKNTWSWATFEQEDNVPPVERAGNDGTSASYSFFNPSCTPAVDAATCAGVKRPDDDPAYQCCENLYRYAAGTVPSNPTPDQVTRIDQAPSGTQSCNAVYDPLDKGVFDHYTLVTTQWPKASDGPGEPTVTPAHSRNAVIETYFTTWQKSGEDYQQVVTSSCMGCHSGRQAVDMSYLFLQNAGG